MNKLLQLFFCLSVLLIACQPKSKNAETPISTKNVAFDELLKDYYEAGLRLKPIEATMSGDNRFNHLFPNFLSDEYREDLKTYYGNYLSKLSKIPDSDLSATEKVSKELLKWECEINLDELEFRKDLFPIDQMWTVNLMVGQLASGAGAQPFETVEDYQNWLTRLERYVTWLNTAKTRMEEGIATGYVLPKALIVKIIPQLKALTVKNLNQHLFYKPVKNLPNSFSSGAKKNITESYNKTLTKKVIPAYQRLYDFMSTEYLAAGRETSGIAAIPNGEAYYAHQIKKYTTTNMTAAEIHQLGLSEVARISAEMEKVKKEVGFEGDLKAFFDEVRNSKKLMPFTKPEQVVANFNAIYDRMKPQVEKLFDLKPKTLFEVRRTEAFRENSASAEYNPGSLDGTRPGIFYVPIPDVKKYNTYSDESLFLHEAIPGHHYQISLTQESEVLPQFRKTLWYSGYGEGWALYCESLGKELGLYTDPYQYFGMLGAEMHRAIRLVVDTGLHSKGWTREEAIAYSLANEAESEASIISEIERYMANPGQALSYKIGQLKIRELRSKGEKALGEKFDIRQFHNEVLETGCVPLAILEDKIEGWIELNREDK